MYNSYAYMHNNYVQYHIQLIFTTYILVGFYLILFFTGFTLPIRDVRASVGAGFLYPLVGTVCIC